MNYVILNDRGVPWFYYAGMGFSMTRPMSEATEDPMQAQAFSTLRAAIAVFDARQDKASLYAQGWRIVPADK